MHQRNESFFDAMRNELIFLLDERHAVRIAQQRAAAAANGGRIPSDERYAQRRAASSFENGVRLPPDARYARRRAAAVTSGQHLT